MDYRQLEASVQDTFKQINTSYGKGISTALWNFSRPELTAMMSGLVNYPFIVHAEISDDGETVIAAGKKLDDRFIETSFPLVYDNNGTLEKLGELKLQASQDLIVKSVTAGVWATLLFRTLAILIVTLVILFLLNRQVVQYLVKASELLNRYNLSSLDDPVVFPKPFRNDEIDQLVNAFNQLRLRLWQSMQFQNEAERKHLTLLENLPGMAYRCRNDRDWTMELVSAGCEDLTGYKPEELIDNIKLSFNDLILPQDRDRIWNVIQTQVTSRSSFELEYRITVKSGQVRWMWERGTGVFSEDHELVALEGFITDITERKQQERDLEAIARVSYALRSVESREKILPIILEQTSNLLDADGCLLELIEPETGDSIVTAANGAFDDFLGFHIPVDKGLNSYIRENGKPYLNNNVFEDPRILDKLSGRSCPASSGVPLIAQGTLIGFLWIGRRVPISEKAVKTLSSIADIAANAIHRVDLFQQTRHRLEQLTALREIDSAINSNVDIKDTMDVFLDQVLNLLHVDAARVMSFDSASKGLLYLDGKGFSTSTSMGPGELSSDQILKNLTGQPAIVQITDTKKIEIPEEISALIDAEKFRAFFATPLIVNNELRGILEVFLTKPYYPDAEWLQFMDTLAGQAAIAITESSLWKNLQQSNSELQIAYDETLEGWSKALDLRDHETENHTRRVIELTLRLAQKMGIDGNELVNIRRGALLHDVGKIGVPDSILTKPGKLTEEEWDIMRKHPTNAFDLIYPIEYLREALDIPYCHHEKWDGSGYPRGLKGEEIPVAARIFAFADVWDAMTSDRYYRAAMPPEAVTEYIRENSGKHFDPAIVELFLEMEK